MLVVFYAERKLAAFIQDRMGPTESGRYGTLQAIADLLKMIQKEDIIPSSADRPLFLFAPLFIFACVFTGFAVMPLGPGMRPSGMETGLFCMLAVVSLDVAGLLMAGRGAGNSKFSLLGAMRAASQVISYEVPLGLTVLSAALLCGSLDLQVISAQQGLFSPDKNYLFGLSGLGIDVSANGGILCWNIFRMPLFFLVFVIYYIATLAECNRAPFDLPEGESELVAGYHTEYSGFRFAIFFLAEYSMMTLVCMLGAILFLGGWNTPLPNISSLHLADYTSGNPAAFSGMAWGFFWLMSKAIFLCLTHIWVRWTFPRLRV
ncbi:MAG: complex I subunit 1 family protein, partial [Bacteroidota bacterium]